MTKIFWVVFIGFITLSCKKEPPTKPVGDINSTVDLAILPLPSPPTSVKYRDTLLEDVPINGVTKKCKTYMADRIQRLSSFDYFYAEDKGDIWPDNLVQSK